MEQKEMIAKEIANQELTPKAKQPVSRGTKIFYILYGCLIALFAIAMVCVLSPLRSWLIRYEASQPEQKAQQVFAQLFANPDWESLYAQAGLSELPFETKETFAQYMTEKIGNQQLTYMETSAGLSNDHKYIVRLGEEKIATFLLTGGTNAQTEIATWELGKIELFLQKNHSVIVETPVGCTVYVNGVALDSSYTIRTVSTRVEAYLPEGLHGYQAQQQQVTGLLMPPTVTATDSAGNPLSLVLDTETGIYKADLPPARKMSQAEKELALGAAQADAAYAIRAISTRDLRKYFDSSSQVYKDICGTYPFLQDYKSYSFVADKFAVDQFYRYSDSFFSVRVSLQMNIVRGSYSSGIKEVPMCKTYFFTKNAAGDYLVTQYTNIPVQEQVQQVRLTFQNADTVVASQMVSADAKTVALPEITAPQGQVFQGWAKRDTAADGKITMTVLFTPNETGSAAVSGEAPLEPMTLYAVFAEEKE